jgi:UDP-glucuronate 4-epimerase
MNGRAEVQSTLVTGSSGFIGRVLTARLRGLGERVIGFDCTADPSTAVDRFVLGDLEDPHRLHAALKGERVASIVHLGGLSGPMLSGDDPYRMMRINVMGTANVLEAARVAGVNRVVFLSSIMAYGPYSTDLTVGDDLPLNAADAYGSSKVAGEAMMRAYAREHGLDTVSLRVSNVYGPGRRTHCLINLMVADALAGKRTEIDYGRGWCRQYIHVDDAAQAVIQVLAHPRLPQPAYNITGGIYVLLDDVGQVISRILPQADIRLGDKLHPFDYPIGPLDITAARRDFDYTPSVSLEDGIAKHIEEYKRIQHLPGMAEAVLNS